MAIYSVYKIIGILGPKPGYTFTIEPINPFSNHLEIKYDALKNKNTWNFGVGFKESKKYPNFNISDNDYV